VSARPRKSQRLRREFVKRAAGWTASLGQCVELQSFAWYCHSACSRRPRRVAVTRAGRTMNRAPSSVTPARTIASATSTGSAGRSSGRSRTRGLANRSGTSKPRDAAPMWMNRSIRKPLASAGPSKTKSPIRASAMVQANDSGQAARTPQPCRPLHRRDGCLRRSVAGARRAVSLLTPPPVKCRR